MTNNPANSHNNPTPQQTDGCDQSKQHVSPKDQLKTLTARVIFRSVCVVCCCYVAQAIARIDVCKNCGWFGPLSHTWVRMKHATDEVFVCVCWAMGLSFTWRWKKRHRCFGSSRNCKETQHQICPSVQGPDARWGCPLSARCRQDRSFSDKMGSSRGTSRTTLKGHLQGASLRGKFGLHTSELPNPAKCSIQP